ncbi:NUDIX domain protein [Cordyceps fumosorosea ARSEF 2679]|uniref:NUDIX domain protein n=1 Tax=Cordyceps fumosorosea (strain ARSEF 2679) TaxID=1081104 RepID=A0A167WNP7_CORFA|nr:NUDIX domain protein [Cordyceps fumosorosea ARSEF 2679]OAA64018.1 NUDIX domain protein [Cordyceps fumosorosea ARSEF 2679]
MAAPKYTFDASLAGFNISRAAFLAANPHLARVMAAAMVFRPNPDPPLTSSLPQTLLICRAATDTYPLRWEVPGGSVDASDATILDGVARELLEESGLVASHMVAPILMSPHEDLPEAVRAGLGIQPDDEGLGAEGLTVTFVETGNLWAKLTVLVRVRSTEEVRLTPEEHEEAAWVTEEQVRRAELPPAEGEAEGRRMDFVSDGVRRSILDGFRVYAQSISGEKDRT